uniref:Protein FAM207A n=1 Tax=Sphenodon punctatus TaxID=8508 RepID=A0A8D0GLF5_SPHPU
MVLSCPERNFGAAFPRGGLQAAASFPLVERVRRWGLHQEVLRPRGTRDFRGSESECAVGAAWNALPGKDSEFLYMDIFAGMNINSKTLVKQLDSDSKIIASTKAGVEEKPLVSKRGKMKMRRDRWLQKIEDMKLAKEQQKAEAKRKATPVVGDMQPLMDALPELLDLITVSKADKHSKSNIMNAEWTDFIQMKPAQKRRLLEEEVSRFHETIANPLFITNPLTAIGEHLSKRLKQEWGRQPLGTEANKDWVYQ